MRVNCAIPVSSKGNDQNGFRKWAVVERALDPAYAKNMEWVIGKMLREADMSFPDREDADRLAAAVMTSKAAKSTKRNNLRALEPYMDYLGYPDIHSCKLHASRKLPKYLTQVN